MISKLKQMIDPKFLKPKSNSPLLLRTFVAPVRIMEYLKSRGVNVSAVCRSAIERALEVGKVPKEDVKQYSFKAPKSLLDRAASQGVNVSDACARALEAVYAELKGEQKKR